jgi:hypothetical protein
MKNILVSTFWFASTTLFAQWNLTGSNLYPANFSTVNVGIGTDAPAEKLHINGSVRGNQAGGALRINTQFGWLDLGPMNATWSHFQTNLPKFYFNKPVHIDGALSSYNTEDLDLQTNGVQRIRILNSNGYVGIGTTMPFGTLQVGGYRPVIIKSNGSNGVYGSELGFNAILNTSIVPNKFTKLGGTGQQGGASIAVDYTGNILFQMYNAGTEDASEINFSPQIAFKNTGNVGIGTTTPNYKLDVVGNLRTSQQISASQFITVDKGGAYRVALNGQADGYISGRNDAVQDRFLINSNGVSFLNGGNVGIGTTTPDQKLTVDGVVKCEEVRVEIFTGTGPDYVFAPDYNLLPLSEVESYIKANKHLPEVPSAKQMEEEGLNLKAMNLLLLKKVEELTLHLIEQQKQIDELKKSK